MLRSGITRHLALAALFTLMACGGTPRRTASEPATPVPLPRAATLPPMPPVEGPLVIHVQYPPVDALVDARDSSFIFGQVGNGRASLTINGIHVPVHPNGSYLAFLPLPPPDSARFDLVAVLGVDTVRLTHSIRLPPPSSVLALDGILVVDSSSASPRAGLALRADEAVRVSVRAPPNATVWLELDTTAAATRALVNGAALPGPRAFPNDTSIVVRDSVAHLLGAPDQWATDVPAPLLAQPTWLVVARGVDTVRLPLASVAIVDTIPRLVILGADPIAVSDTDRMVFARPQPDDTYKWFLLPGTRLELTGRSGTFVRVRLDRDLEAWVPAADARLLDPGTPMPRRVARNARVVPGDGWSDFIVPMNERPAYLVMQDDRSMTLTLYGTRSSADVTRFASNDSTVRLVTWDQETNDRVRFTLHLAQRPFGYLAFWDEARSAFVLRVRRPPMIRASRSPLRGLTITVDPGHPPAGATGPTGFFEGDAVLAVGQRMRTLLEQRGATVVMTRTTSDPVALADRPIIARRANSHALVSIHLNALPDGVNPFNAHGTETYFLHPQAAPLARAAQGRMVARMGLRNNGIFSRTLALARPTWMPSILAEGAYIMIPEQEAALKTPQYQEAYARALVEALEEFFRGYAR
jgi:N-acetylmuramoyl-L-alanine amidase